MLAISLTDKQLEKINLLLRDIKTVQKLNDVFDYEAIQIFEFNIIFHLNKDGVTKDMFGNETIINQ